jgi:hypothetical protein
MRMSNLAVEELHSIAEGKRKRGAGFQIAAIRLMAEHTLPKPEQRHELSGNVTITVECAIPTRASQAQHLVVEASQERLQERQGLVIPSYVTNTISSGLTNEPEPISDPEPPMIHEDGRLRADSSVALTAEERRAKARDEWQAEQAELRQADGNE